MVFGTACHQAERVFCTLEVLNCTSLDSILEHGTQMYFGSPEVPFMLQLKVHGPDGLLDGLLNILTFEGWFVALEQQHRVALTQALNPDYVLWMTCDISNQCWTQQQPHRNDFPIVGDVR
jgi:hypothetical protein